MTKNLSRPSLSISLLFLAAAVACVCAVAVASTKSQARAADPRQDIPPALLSDTSNSGHSVAGTIPRNGASLQEYRRSAQATADCTRRKASNLLRGLTVRTTVTESRDRFSLELGVSVRATPGTSLDGYGAEELDRLSDTLSECREISGLSRVERSYQVAMMQDEEFVRRSGGMLVACLRRAGIRNLPANVTALEVRQDIVISIMQASEQLQTSASVTDCAAAYPATLTVIEP